MNTKFYTLEEEQVQQVQKLFDNKIDNQYVVLSTYNNYADIIQYSTKYQNVHIVSVQKNKLDLEKELY